MSGRRHPAGAVHFWIHQGRFTGASQWKSVLRDDHRRAGRWAAYAIAKSIA
jgi:hypothetical protein